MKYCIQNLGFLFHFLRDIHFKVTYLNDFVPRNSVIPRHLYFTRYIRVEILFNHEMYKTFSVLIILAKNNL